MLLRISQDPEEYRLLSQPLDSEWMELLDSYVKALGKGDIDGEEWKASTYPHLMKLFLQLPRMQALRAKLENDISLSEQTKESYLELFDKTALLYFHCSSLWKNRESDMSWKLGKSEKDDLRYYKSDELIAILQCYAKAGQIVAMVGNLNDIVGNNVTLVDASNCGDYGPFRFPFQARVIWTAPRNKGYEFTGDTDYFSYNHHPADDATYQEVLKAARALYDLNRLLSTPVWKDLRCLGLGLDERGLFNPGAGGDFDFAREPMACCSPQVIVALNNYLARIFRAQARLTTPSPAAPDTPQSPQSS